MSETDARALANQIAKILDREGVKPPLRLQAWDAIHNAIEAFIRAEREAAHAAGFIAGATEEINARATVLEDVRQAGRAEGRREERAHAAKLMRELQDGTQRPEQRLCFGIAENSIRRGRNLTATEKLDNLAKAFEEEGDHKSARIIRGQKP